MKAKSTNRYTFRLHKVFRMIFQTKILFIFFVFFVLDHLMVVSESATTPQHSLQTDKNALLEFKKTIKIDPKSALSNWNKTTKVCSFNGIICKNGNRVRRITLVGAGLVGPFSPVIGNLTALRTINLSDNSLYGKIPFGISSLRHLRNLYLDNNNLQGPIPESLSLLSNLTLLDLGNNHLDGEIPPSLFSNCSFLSNLDLSFNLFTGNIPVEIGNCPKLWNLNLYNNQFTGEIPLALANASEMYNLDVESNNLSGELPSKLVSKLTQLLNLHLSYNQMVSHDENNNLDIFFTALSNCSMLRELELAGMGLGGTVPNSIGKLGVHFSYLLLQENKIYGKVPSVIANLSSLIYLNLTMNRLNGTIAPEISELARLDKLWLSHNVFTGEIPEEFGQFRHLGELELSHNRFTGEIPESLGNLVSLISLSLNNNQLSGKIPSTLGKCVILSSLDLSYNRLMGNIPSELLSAMSRNAIFLNLSHNRLEGPLPSELSKLETVKEINLSFNNLTGTIFPKIPSYMALETLDLSFNSFQGQLPEFLTKLTSLEVFDVSNNSLSGKIPMGFSKIDSLELLNLSFNNFNGRVPEGGVFDSVTNLSFLGNPHLCGHVSGLPFCSHKKKYFHSPVFLVVFYVVILVSVLLTTICCVIGWRYLKSNAKPETKSQPELTHNFPRITYKELAEATGGFDEQRLLGSGGYGRVFRGSLRDGTQIAVKVLQLQTGNSTKSFNRECQVLKTIRHRNLIRIITACSLPDFKALVLPFMANGSLDSRLYPDSELGSDSDSSDLNLIQRVNICSDIAEGMAYLHHHSPIKVIHCDLKPSNVLLNDDMTALVSDFGIAKLAMTIGSGSENLGNSTANTLCGSIGYIPPEYGYGSSPSTKGDVYSFGILVLEMVTRRKPTDEMFSNGISLHKWVKSHYHRQDVVDSSLVQTSRDQSSDVKKMWEVAIGELLEMGILCTQESPANRPTMMDVADDLDRLKRYLSGDITTTFASSLGISSSTMSDC